MERLGLSATISEYESQAVVLLGGHAGGDPGALRIINENHPRFLDPVVRWKPLPVSADEIRGSPFDLDDARLALARWYSFRDWSALFDLVEAIQTRAPGVYDFETAAEAVITGDVDRLRTMLRDNPGLVTARSSRMTCHDPAQHRATLLHYVAANGVEGYRQRTPANAVEVAKTLLEAGAEPDALAGMYGGECTTLSMLVSSSPPADAGVQVPLTETLLDYGADPNGRGTGNWIDPLMTALIFGFRDAAEVLARRGARTDHLAAAAGLNGLDEAKALLTAAGPEERHRALALAAHHGHVEIVRLLLDAGEDPNRYNPEGMHSHGTPLHHAAGSGYDAVVRLLVDRGARGDARDKIWNGTPRRWAEHGGHSAVADYLRANDG
jgi:ankyrin repeat protein